MLIRIYNSCTDIRKKSPLSLIFLTVIYVCFLILTRGDHSSDIASSIFLGVLLCIYLLIYITNIFCLELSSRWKYCISVGLTGLTIVGWYMIQPTPTGVESTYLFILGCMTLISMVGVRGIKNKATDKNIYDRVFHLIKHIFIALGVSLLLGGGLSLGFLAIDNLFDVDIAGERYSAVRGSSFILLGGISFVDGLISGKIITSQEKKTQKRQRVLAGIIGLLLLIFGVILYTYIIKILATGTRPSNEVTLRGFIYCGLIIIASIILLPLRQEDYKHIYTIRQYMYISMLPVCFIIAWAISQRVAQYGITVDRYIVIISLCRVVAVSLCIIIKKHFRIYRIFVMLMLFGCITMFGGPIGSKSIAYNSQIDRLTTLLEISGNRTDDGLILPVTNIQTKKEISNIANYIDRYLDISLENLDPARSKEDIYTGLGITQRFSEESKSANKVEKPVYMYFDTDNKITENFIEGYSKIYTNINIDNLVENTISIGNNGDTLNLDISTYIKELSTIGTLANTIYLSEIDSIYRTNEFALIPEFMIIKKEGSEWIITNFRGILLVK